MFFEGPSTKIPFEPHYFIELSKEHFEKKLEALKCYQTQIKKGIVNLDAIELTGKLHGVKHQAQYAEAFAINHVVRKGDNV